MRCWNKACRWNLGGEDCGFPYEISIAENGRCNQEDLAIEKEDDE